MSALCLKISYRGLLQHIDCTHLAKNEFYNNIIELVLERFSLPATCKPALIFSIAGDCSLNKDSFEYYLQLFPCPESIFYLRLDYSKLAAPPAPIVCTANKGSHNSNKVPFGLSQANNELPSEESASSMAVSVHRQNCFIGSWPGERASTSVARNNAVAYTKLSTKRRVQHVMKKYKCKQNSNTSTKMSIRL